MNTFLPYADFYHSAQCLDRQRLNKQRSEVLSLVQAIVLELLGQKSRTSAHPACRMWKGHLFQLIQYGKFICDEWTRRGYKDNVKSQLIHFENVQPDTGMPSWWKDPAFHASMRANLIRKDPEYYQGLGWTEEPQDVISWPRVA